MTTEKIFPENIKIEKVTVDVYKTPDGKLFLNELDAIESAITHNYCECGKEKPKSYGQCLDCQEKSIDEQYGRKPVKNYTAYSVDVFYDDVSKQYFDSLTKFAEYMKEHKDSHREYPKTRLYPTKPVYMPSLDFDLDEWAQTSEDLPEGHESLIDFIPKDHPILEKLETLKKLIDEIESEEVILRMSEPDFRYRLVF